VFPAANMTVRTFGILENDESGSLPAAAGAGRFPDAGDQAATTFTAARFSGPGSKAAPAM